MLRGWIVVRLRQSLRCQKQGWRLRQVHHVHHILMEETEGQDVVLNILEVFVNRWRHVLANVTSLWPERGEREQGRGRKQHLISNGTKDAGIQRRGKRKIREKSIKNLILAFVQALQLKIIYNTEHTKNKSLCASTVNPVWEKTVETLFIPRFRP